MEINPKIYGKSFSEAAYTASGLFRWIDGIITTIDKVFNCQLEVQTSLLEPLTCSGVTCNMFAG